MRSVHQVDERKIVQRLYKMDVCNALQQTIDRFADVGVQVYRVENFNVRMGLGCIDKGLADTLKAIAKAFPAVTGNQDQLLVGVEEVELLTESFLQALVAV